jgi:dCMP deaminase
MRISRNQMFMEMARSASKRSTCHRLNVGCVIVVENRVVSIGYNGSPSGEEHCKGNHCPLSTSGGCSKSLHAEDNAIRFIPNSEWAKDKSIYVTHSPCLMCAEKLMAAGIKAVYYEVAYRDTTSLALLIKSGIEVYQVTPSGYLLDHSNNKVIMP